MASDFTHTWHASASWFCLVPLALLLPWLPALLWKGRRLSYATAVCAVALGLLGYLWVSDIRSLEGVGFWAITDAEAYQDQSMVHLDVGGGGILVRRLYVHGTHPRVERERRDRSADLRSRIVWYRYGKAKDAYPALQNSSFTNLGLGFGFLAQREMNPAWGASYRLEHAVVLPIWAAMVAFAVLPILAIPRLLKQRRRRCWLRQGRCLACGYQLCGTPANAGGTRRCSECGTVNPATPPSSDKADPPKITSAPS